MAYTVKIHTFKDGKVMLEDRIAYANGEFISLDDFDTEIQSRNNEITQLKHDLEKTYNQLMEVEKEAQERIEEFESELKTKDNIQKINLNETIKVKLTPYGAEIYYKQLDEVNKQCGREICKPQMPRIDKDGYTELQLWHFIELYGQHIGMCKPNIIEPLDIVYCKHNREDEE